MWNMTIRASVEVKCKGFMINDKLAKLELVGEHYGQLGPSHGMEKYHGSQCNVLYSL